MHRYTLSEFLSSFFLCPFPRIFEKPSEKDPMEQYVPTRSTAKSGMRGVGGLELGGLLLEDTGFGGERGEIIGGKQNVLIQTEKLLVIGEVEKCIGALYKFQR